MDANIGFDTQCIKALGLLVSEMDSCVTIKFTILPMLSFSIFLIVNTIPTCFKPTDWFGVKRLKSFSAFYKCVMTSLIEW